MKPNTRTIRARANAATKDMSSWTKSATEGYVAQGAHLGETLIALDDTYENSPADCAFLASAREDVPALCDRVEELEKALEVIGGRLLGEPCSRETLLREIREALKGTP